jgi:hypothetical protein
MPTKRRHRTRHLRQQHSAAVRALLETGDWDAGGPDGFFEILLLGKGDLAAAWTDLREEMWQHDRPGTRPMAWWGSDAPEPHRRRVGGTGDIFASPQFEFGIPTPSSFTQPWQVEYYNGRDIPSGAA